MSTPCSACALKGQGQICSGVGHSICAGHCWPDVPREPDRGSACPIWSANILHRTRISRNRAIVWPLGVGLYANNGPALPHQLFSQIEVQVICGRADLSSDFLIRPSRLKHSLYISTRSLRNPLLDGILTHHSFAHLSQISENRQKNIIVNRLILNL